MNGRQEDQEDLRNQLCDAHFRALIPREGDDSVLRGRLSRVQLPPAPGEQWFWERVADEFERWKRFVE